MQNELKQLRELIEKLKKENEEYQVPLFSFHFKFDRTNVLSLEMF